MIYLDHNATTPVASEVLEAMMPFLTTDWGNPSSSYRFGAKLRSALEAAREQVAQLIGAHSGEILFTSCASESNSLAICSGSRASPKKRHIVTSVVEHSSVLNCCKALEKDGVKVTYLPVDRDGLLNLADLEAAITEETALVSLMWANNETGVLFPIVEAAQLCKSRGVLIHCDAVQAVGKVPIDLGRVPVDYLSVTGHKINAPKGIGVLYVRRRAPISPLIHGGHQERGLRGGTENVSMIVGFGKAAELARGKLPNYETKVRPLRDALEQSILCSIPNSELNGHPEQRLANTTNISFHGIESEALLLLLDQEEICASSGSACLADSSEPSHVIRAMRNDGDVGRNMIRLSLDICTTAEEVQRVVEVTRSATEALRI